MCGGVWRCAEEVLEVCSCDSQHAWVWSWVWSVTHLIFKSPTKSVCYNRCVGVFMDIRGTGGAYAIGDINFHLVISNRVCAPLKVIMETIQEHRHELLAVMLWKGHSKYDN